MFYSPWWLWFLLLLPVIAWRLFANRGTRAIRFTSLGVARRMAPTLRQRILWLPRVLTLLGIALLILGLARPQEGREQAVQDGQGIAIELVVDCSGSMQAMDFEIEGEHVDRLTAIKNVAGKFVSGDGQLEGRYSDLIGLITFAGFADGITPPTLDHGFLLSSLNKAQIVSIRREDGTAIGDSLALAVEKLNALDIRQDEEMKSKIVILLTDGENTAGELEPLEAAELAQAMGIKVYTIGVGTKGQAPFPVRDSFTGREVIRFMQVNIDETTLKEVAKVTGGKYFRATDTDSLVDIYKEIDQLEKTKVESNRFNYRELAVKTYQFGLITVPPVFLLAMFVIVVGFALQQTWLREVV